MPMRLKYLFLIGLVSIWSSQCLAEEQHPIEQSLDACLEENVSTAGIIECNDKAIKAWDTELNKVYKSLMSKLDKKTQASLKQSQRQWIKFRDAEFEAMGAIYRNMEGTMWRVVASDATVNVVKTRVLQLKSYENDLDAQSE